MRRSPVFVWLLMSLMVVLAPIAWASPIDPSWIKGVYDDGDFDDVVVFLTSGTIAIPALPLADILPILVYVRVEATPDDRLDAPELYSLYAPRGPPSS
jgi:hypothetical protein